MINLRKEIRKIQGGDCLVFSFEELEEKEIRLIEGDVIISVGERMMRESKDFQGPIVICFNRVSFISSRFLNYLILLEKRKNRIFLCGIGLGIMQIFVIARLNLLFTILDNVEDVLEVERVA